MRYLIFASFIVTLMIVGCRVMPAAHSSSKPFLIGADSAPLADYPGFVVLINTKRGLSKSHCSGARIAPHFIITSASCLFPKHDPDSINITAEIASQKHAIASIQFVERTKAGDDSDIKVRTIPAGFLYRIDVHPGYATANLERTKLMVHNLALITHIEYGGGGGRMPTSHWLMMATTSLPPSLFMVWQEALSKTILLGPRSDTLRKS